MSIRVFISYSQDDTKLALALKYVLEESSEIDEAFVFEQKKQYGIQIDKKITNEIDHSDYLIAIVTQNAQESASVNQELGYAQGNNIDKIPMVEKGAAKGVLTYGNECTEFSKANFRNKCVEIRKYILSNGPKSARYKKRVIESAYYRKTLEHNIYFFLESVYYRFNVGGDNMSGLVDYGHLDISKTYIGRIEKFFNKEETELVNHMSKMSFEMYEKLDSELMLCKKEITDAERFPHEKLTQKEKEPITKLKENLRLMNENDLNVGQYCEDTYDQKPSREFTNCYEIKQFDLYKARIQRHLKWILYDLQKIILLMTELAMIFLEYRGLFGETAFKSAT